MSGPDPTIVYLDSRRRVLGDPPVPEPDLEAQLDPEEEAWADAEYAFDLATAAVAARRRGEVDLGTALAMLIAAGARAERATLHKLWPWLTTIGRDAS